MSDTEDLAALNDRLMAKNHALAEALSRAGKELTKAKSQLAQLAQPPLTFATMLAVSISTSAMTTVLKKQDMLRLDSERARMRADLLRAVSHDLRTPLTSIAGSAAVLLENEQLRSENLVNQYEALKSQLNPHMLFNSLNTLYSLIRESPDKAQNYLQELSRVMRYTLHDNLSHTVSLNEEMSFVHSYLYLLQMRYEDNLHFDIDIPQELLQRQVPPMAVQMLVENAVKHNEISNRNPLTIRIHAEGNGLCVSNRIQPKLTDSSSTCIGLANLSKRYRLLFGKDITIEESNNDFKVTLPLI